MKVICVTGTPGTGKTTLSKKLSKILGFEYLDVNNIISKNKLSEGYDKKRKTEIIDTDKLNEKIIDEINVYKTKNKKGVIIDSHLSHYLPKRYVKFCIVVKCDIKKLNARLKRRGYSKEKIEENLQSEIFDVCYNEAMERKHKVFLIDGSKSFNINSLTKKIGG